MFDWILHFIHRDRHKEIRMHTDRPHDSREEWREEQEWRALAEILETQREILEVQWRILRMLEPRFTLHIQQQQFHFQDHREDGIYELRTVYHMAAITAGQSATFFLTATASDNSTVQLANATLTADDSQVQIATDPSDASGLTFTVTVPASDTQTSFNLNATAQATSNTSTTPQEVTATLPVTISPSSVPVTFQMAINEK